MFCYYNAHPLGLNTNDCTKRAISACTCIPYNEVQKELNRCKKITNAKYFYTDGNPHYYVEKVLGCKRIPYYQTVSDFCNQYPVGRYILSLKGHWTAVIDGNCYDTHDCTNEIAHFFYDMSPAVLPNPTLPPLRYCFTVEQTTPQTYTICFYDGNSNHSQKTVAAKQLDGYLQCLIDFGHQRAPLLPKRQK